MFLFVYFLYIGHPRIIRNDHQPDRFDGDGWSHRRRRLG